MSDSPRGFSKGLALALPVTVIAAGFFIAFALVETAPKAERKAPEPQALLVDAVEITLRDVRVRVQGMGPVTPAREVEVRAQVGGEIVELSDELIPGGLFREDDPLLRIEPKDYELVVRQRRSEVAEAERDLKLELGQQEVARREYELLGEVITDEDRELVLRRPQLASARLRLAAAEAALEDAELDLARTAVKAPFNAFVRDKHVDVGEIVATTTPLVTLVGTDEFWVEISLPVDDLRWLEIPRRGDARGSPVEIHATGGKRKGHVARLAGDLEPEGRMARIIVSVSDPMALDPGREDEPGLLIGAYVRAEILGKRIEQVAPLARGLVREGGVVWVIDENETLEIRPVDIVYRGREQVIVAGGLQEGDRVISTDLPAAVAGMPLRLRDVVPLAIGDDTAFAAEDEPAHVQCTDDERTPG